jgi:hypothetical protein
LAQFETNLYRGCLESARHAGLEAGCRVVVASPDAVERLPGTVALAQRGQSFGERLAHAVAEASAAVDGPVLVVPSDVPGITGGHVRRATSWLDEDPEAVVVGPSPDGGLYLLATARPLPPELLRRVHWCGRHTRADLLRRLAMAGRRVVLLEPLADLDGPTDLERWLAAPARLTRGWVRLRGRLRAALRERTVARPVDPLVPCSPGRRPFAGRAPPRLRAA